MSDTTCPPKVYAGVGSRETPQEVLNAMRSCASKLAEGGWTLRSGAAPGADTWFEIGCDDAGGSKEIYLPWASFRGRTVGHRGAKLPGREALPRLEGLAKKYWDPSKCPWSRLRSSTRSIMTRNVCQVLGEHGDEPAQAVLYWTPLPESGGTTQALRIARAHDIPCIRIGADTTSEKLLAQLNGTEPMAKPTLLEETFTPPEPVRRRTPRIKGDIEVEQGYFPMFKRQWREGVGEVRVPHDVGIHLRLRGVRKDTKFPEAGCTGVYSVSRWSEKYHAHVFCLSAKEALRAHLWKRFRTTGTWVEAHWSEREWAQQVLDNSEPEVIGYPT